MQNLLTSKIPRSRLHIPSRAFQRQFPDRYRMRFRLVFVWFFTSETFDKRRFPSLSAPNQKKLEFKQRSPFFANRFKIVAENLLWPIMFICQTFRDA
ncbi:hypothetical protein BIU88_07520 [Chlorobaculum limnaeum]|uniref:Uncharacterized protein n=1 Tax=Chlorobaculum limnaeum TaxID=274537 RepID=A0A1D8CYJ6_CHLLM|nr:hypothetical protein BIU88_07520 [Chlorobaculum limnaeum]